uniref:LolE permease component of an ABC-transporter system n=1 Tax=uncultured bacterium CSLF43 TaxID=1091575 RepID=G4WW11_9BACT|nr:LolE permease component of an ABC-transporter system [uncultured bacterium CSLF43]
MGFLGAASRLIDSTDTDIWITGRGVPCFEFPVPLERRFVEIAHSVPGVGLASRICTRLVQFRMRDGRRQMVALVGADTTVGRRFPIPHIAGGATVEPDALLVDRSNTELLDLGRIPAEVEINDQRARVTGETSGFSSFLGSPYVFTSYGDAARYMGLDSQETMFIALRVSGRVTVRDVQNGLKARLPSVDVWTRAQFSRKARTYWLTQTGAGGAILMAAMLGFCIGLAVVSQSVYATTMENLEEFATLKAMGASRQFVTGVILAQALICGIAGYLLGLAITFPMIQAAKAGIPWVTSPWWLPVCVLIPTLGMCALASLMSVRAALSVEPAKVFRA